MSSPPRPVLLRQVPAAPLKPRGPYQPTPAQLNHLRTSTQRMQSALLASDDAERTAKWRQQAQEEAEAEAQQEAEEQARAKRKRKKNTDPFEEQRKRFEPDDDLAQHRTMLAVEEDGDSPRAAAASQPIPIKSKQEGK